MAPVFLNLAEVLEIHRDQIERYGGQAGIRDLGLLQSALAMPAAGFGGRYLHEDLLEMAAVYLFHIARNHPFVDGNKRTGAVAALVFLSLNDIEIVAICRRGRERQKVPILDLPLPEPRPEGSEWIDAYRRWVKGR